MARGGVARGGVAPSRGGAGRGRKRYRRDISAKVLPYRLGARSSGPGATWEGGGGALNAVMLHRAEWRAGEGLIKRTGLHVHSKLNGGYAIRSFGYLDKNSHKSY